MNSLEYYKIKRVSNSLLGMLSNPRWVKLKADNPDMEDEDKIHFRIGSGVDCLLSTPERWSTDFMVVNAKRPFGLMASFIDNLPPFLEKDSDTSLYQIAYDKSGYKMRIEKVIEKFWDSEEFSDYYILTRQVSKGTTILSNEEYDTVLKCVELIKSNKFLSDYFRTAEETDGLVETHYQVPILFNILDTDCKALLDLVVIDHEGKTISPIDLKTTGRSVLDFSGSFLLYGYYRQAAFYTYALQSENSPYKELLEQGYKIEPFRFIVVETKKSSSMPALLYEVTPEVLELGRSGGIVKNKKYKGYLELLEDYKWHFSTNQWDMSRELYENKGKIVLTLDEL